LPAEAAGIVALPIVFPYEISTPEIWKLTAAFEAPPVITFVATRTCFKSIKVVEFAAIETAVAIAVPAKAIVQVYADAPVLVTTMFETTVVVEAGTV
jgi:hypothetical protein